MKATELIKRLQELVEDRVDCEVISDYDVDTIHGVEYLYPDNIFVLHG